MDELLLLDPYVDIILGEDGFLSHHPPVSRTQMTRLKEEKVAVGHTRPKHGGLGKSEGHTCRRSSGVFAGDEFNFQHPFQGPLGIASRRGRRGEEGVGDWGGGSLRLAVYAGALRPDPATRGPFVTCGEELS